MKVYLGKEQGQTIDALGEMVLRGSHEAAVFRPFGVEVVLRPKDGRVVISDLSVDGHNQLMVPSIPVQVLTTTDRHRLYLPSVPKSVTVSITLKSFAGVGVHATAWLYDEGDMPPYVYEMLKSDPEPA